MNEHEQLLLDSAEDIAPPDMENLASLLTEILASEMYQKSVLNAPVAPTDTDDLVPVDVVEEEVITAIDPVTGKRRITVYNDGVMDKDAERLHRMCQVSAKFASTLALRQIHAEVSDDRYGDAPAWSDTDSITFQRQLIGDVADPEVVTALKGLTLHELSHILLTPRYGSNLAKEVQKDNLWRAFNALEDQRIEMYMTTKYGSTAPWLLATVAKHLLNKPSQVVVAYPLTHGRKYLPKDLRDAVRNAYEDQTNVAELGVLIDQYITLNLGDPSTYPEALRIIRRYHELVEQLQPQDPEYPYARKGWQRIQDPNGHDSRKEGEWKSSSTSKPLSKGEQASVIARMSENSSNTDDDGDDDEPMSGQGGMPKQGNTSGDSDAPGTGVSGASGVETVRDIARRAFDNVLKSKAHDIATSIKQFTGEVELNSKPLPAPRRPDWVIDNNVSPDTVQASKSFGAELVRLRADYDPGWDRRTESGKLNVQRYVTGCEVDEAFDQWDMGREDAVDIECVILLDTSGSMGGVIQGAYESMWAIKRAMDKINASTTVVLYSHRTELLYSANERASTKMRYAGLGNNTVPLKGLRYARSVLGNSKRAIKICIAITDGWWDDSKACDAVLAHLRKAGVLTALAYMENPWNLSNNPNYVPNIDSHGCEVAVHITEPRDLFSLAKSMVKAGIRRNIGS